MIAFVILSRNVWTRLFGKILEKSNNELADKARPWKYLPAMTRLHFHLISDSTGETLENIAKAAIAQFDNVEVVRHFWPMVRTNLHLDRILAEVEDNPGMILYTLVNPDLRESLERRVGLLNLPVIAALDAVTDALSQMLGQKVNARPGRQHAMNAAYYARVEAIQFTVTHDDGIGAENWEEADIVLVGVSRTSKTPTSIYLANRGYKTANIPFVPQSPLPKTLFHLNKPLIVGLTAAADRLVQIRRNRLLSLNESPETPYAENNCVRDELAYARRIFADHDWPVIDVTRRSIEETAAAVIKLSEDRQAKKRKTQQIKNPQANHVVQPLEISL